MSNDKNIEKFSKKRSKGKNIENIEGKGWEWK
jgi:hypothetical protein